MEKYIEEKHKGIFSPSKCWVYGLGIESFKMGNIQR